MATKSSKPKIIAGMPAYNEGKYIGTLVLNTRQYVDEVIVVDDGSSDNTAEIARLAGADVIRHRKNKGYGAAIQSIIAEAKKRDPDILVVLDADDQHSPQEIPHLIKPIQQEGCDFVIGSREEQKDNIPFYRRIGQKVILRSISLLSKNRLTDSECGFRAFSRKAISTLKLKENGMAVSAETVAEATSRDLKVAEVPVSVTYSKDSSTHNPVRHGLGVFTRILVMISERRPLFFFGMAGTILIVLGVIAGVRVIHLFSDSGILPVGTTMVAVVFLVIGMFSVFTGLILRALSRWRE